jgi:hypothetical protein
LSIKYSTAKAIVKRYRETGVLSARIKAPEEIVFGHNQEEESRVSSVEEKSEEQPATDSPS